mmetsp:Transcript_91608/g.255137  ORF Transcript_91608/g.255137 Transcript_91608/m.255137 type:complete len:255 (-) Transcript_91608:224-988(-)
MGCMTHSSPAVANTRTAAKVLAAVAWSVPRGGMRSSSVTPRSPASAPPRSKERRRTAPIFAVWRSYGSSRPAKSPPSSPPARSAGDDPSSGSCCPACHPPSSSMSSSAAPLVALSGTSGEYGWKGSSRLAASAEALKRRPPSELALLFSEARASGGSPSREFRASNCTPSPASSSWTSGSAAAMPPLRTASPKPAGLALLLATAARMSSEQGSKRDRSGPRCSENRTWSRSSATYSYNCLLRPERLPSSSCQLS